MQPQQPTPTPTPPLQSYPAPDPAGQLPEPPKPSKKKYIIIAIVLLVFFGPSVAYFVTKSLGGKEPGSGTVTLPSVSTDISAGDVAKLDKEASFWGYFKNAAMQPQLVTEHKQYDTDKPGLTKYYKLGFDFKSKALQAAYEEEMPDTPGREKMRCYDGKYYFTTTRYESEWDDTSILDKPGFCDIKKQAMYLVVDGTNTGGLSDAQANAFVSYLRDKEGLSHVRSLQLEEHGGKNYLHYTVDFVPIPTYDGYGSNIWFGTAFDKTGLDADEWPYYKGGVIGGGTHLEYYVDPATSLPVYSKITGLPMKDKAGKDQELTDFSVSETRYYFGKSTFDVDISNNADLKLDWL